MSPTLGKRSRTVLEDVSPQTPRRTTRTTKPVIYDAENIDPEVVDDEVLDILEDLPSTKRQRTASKRVPVTPTTPRHRHVLSDSPSTPRHVVMSAGKLFKRMTPSSPLTPSAVQTVYHSARQVFTHGAEPGTLVGREEERATLTAFLARCNSKDASGCLYVSGPPGTGKSAMITELLQPYSTREDVKSVYINCMSIKSSKDLYNTLLGALGEGEDRNEADAMSTLQEVLCQKKQGSASTCLVTLDEIDHILTLGLESLYRLFEWSLQSPSRLLLIGIANALDLTDRFLPRLKSKNLKPELLPFLPYSAPQVKNIITTRLKSLLPAGAKEGFVPFIHPAAIELCSRKVASQTGDLRKAFEICRRALDLIEQEVRSKHEDEAREELLQMTPSKKPLGEKINGASSDRRSIVQIMAKSLKELTADDAPRASIGHLNKVTAAAFSNGTTQRLKALNLQQKAALCALVAYERRAREKVKASAEGTPSKSRTLAPTVRILFDTYSTCCTRDAVLHPLSSSEFREVVGSLETLGLVNAVDGKNGSFVTPQTPSRKGRKPTAASGDDRRVACAAGDKDMESMAEGIGAGILKAILSGEALD
ncbi:P-loop containing nucleoside triphosphate hydrolase protein [Emericellopsis atlantica]|uniref:Cell division control protein n=1 Tax=Emericellopsis atlantica TaxID=2614577 RepID=A0A9P7ZDC4_9HYPO|nr:P-loop containing nucleoside triphosphate hydrolase protein [Emericellopsis atlantica]KAG9249836.1 P-loop containing nucleoside triphosphate hydrolase protein [Emericellopsis atlantica]